MNQHEDEIGRGLFEAISQALQAVNGGTTDPSLLRGSFRRAVEGVGAERAFLARVGAPPESLDVLDSHGLSGHDVHAVRVGVSAPGLSVSVVRRALTTGRTQHIEDTRLVTELERTLAFLDAQHSVICAPVCDPQTRLPLAVLYFQSGSLARPLTTPKVPHVNAYASALGLAWGMLRRSRRDGAALRDELARARTHVEAAGDSDVMEIVGRSERTEALRRLLDHVVVPALSAPRADPVLILGPTGSGKEVVARYLHRHSARRRAPFVGFNCATFRGEILESKLFGHVKGAFTGAVADAEGVFMAAHGGVLFLDEVGDMPEEAQAMLLRALETRSVRPVGGRDERPVDVLLLCATNVDLEDAVRRGRFRSDLYHRINGLSVRISALSERRDDVKPLLAYYLAFHERRLGRRTGGLSADALEALESYDWPGNVRELSRACSTLILHAAPDGVLDMAVLARALPQASVALASRLARADEPAESPFERDYGSWDAAVRAVKRELLMAVARKFQGRRSAMARYLCISRSTLYRTMVTLGLDPEDEDAPESEVDDTPEPEVDDASEAEVDDASETEVEEGRDGSEEELGDDGE